MEISQIELLKTYLKNAIPKNVYSENNLCQALSTCREGEPILLPKVSYKMNHSQVCYIKDMSSSELIILKTQQ